MVKKYVGRYVKKYGMVKLLMMIGDYAVGATKSKKDDKVWEEVKMLLETFTDE
tara:strand:+ start:299 stop:457 length:159 start_codon:yes stop_codon:yes gene_type:complete